METKYYIGEKEIMMVAVLDKKLASGTEFVRVTFTDSTSKEMSKTRFNLLQSESPVDASGIQQVVKRNVGSLIYSLMHEYGLTVTETNDVLDEAAQLVQNAMDKATNILFGVEYPTQRTVNQINDILIEHANKNNSNDSASTGGGTVAEDQK